MSVNDCSSRENEKLFVKQVIIVTTTCKNKKEAEKIIRHLLTKRLIACAEIHPIESIYWWNGKIEKAKETSLVLKTTKRLVKKVESEIEKIHSYDTPVIVAIKPEEINKKGKAWLRKEVK